jgi:hypothetical protein
MAGNQEPEENSDNQNGGIINADKLVRETLFNRFRELEGQVSALQRDFISQGELGEVGKLEATSIKLRTLLIGCGRRGAVMPGYLMQ